MKSIRRETQGIAIPLLIIVLVVVIALVFVGLYVAGYLSPASGATCPPSVCPIGGSKPVWIRVDVTGTVVPNVGSPPTILSSSLAMTAAIATTPASLVKPPQLFLDETWELSGTIAVSYPNGETHSYNFPSIKGINQANFDLFYFVQGPNGAYTMTASLLLQQTGCWLGCSAPASYTITGHFNL